MMIGGKKMKKIKNGILFISLISFFLFLCPFKVDAGSAYVGFSGNNSVYNGNEITVSMYVSNISGASGGVESLEANLRFDSNYLEYLEGQGVTSPYKFFMNIDNNYKIAGLDTYLESGITSTTTVFTFRFRAKQVGDTTISLANLKLTDAASKLDASAGAKTISIVNPPSGNNNLSSLSTNLGGFSFNGGTNYNMTVENDITSINVSATAEDSKASVSGTGTRALNYGGNAINVVVRAENGSEKTYTINVTRKDNRSGNNNLASLGVPAGQLSPAFNKNTLEYSLSVPFSVSSLNVSAAAEDPKAKVSVYNTNLVSEETVDVKVTVTAENGGSKTYTIHTLRGKDPNKVLSTNNYLSNLTISDGLLSPSFSKEQEKYVVYLPYEVENINIDYNVEDTRYATVAKEVPDKLSVGNNLYKYTVTAEDESQRVYTVTVVRGKSLLENDLSNNTFLKELTIKGGNLDQFFDKNVRHYIYTGGTVSFKPEDENSKTNMINNDGVITILVEAESGDIGVYTLVPSKHKSFNIFLIIFPVIALIIGFVVGYILKKKKNDDGK